MGQAQDGRQAIVIGEGLAINDVVDQAVPVGRLRHCGQRRRLAQHQHVVAAEAQPAQKRVEHRHVLQPHSRLSTCLHMPSYVGRSDGTLPSVKHHCKVVLCLDNQVD